MKKHKYLFVIFISLVSLNAQGSDGRIDCENVEDCPVDYTCRLGECVPDVDQDRDFDGVPNAGDNCIDVPITNSVIFISKNKQIFHEKIKSL